MNDLVFLILQYHDAGFYAGISALELDYNHSLFVFLF